MENTKNLYSDTDLFKNVDSIDISDYSSLLQMSEYINDPSKNIYVCFHPSYSSHSYHTHDFYEINYVYSGECINIIDGEKIYMQPCDFVLIHPGVFHTIHAKQQSIIINILIRSTFFNEVFSKTEVDDRSPLSIFLSNSPKNNYYKFITCEAECAKNHIMQLIKEERSHRFNAKIMQESYICSLMCTLMRNNQKSSLSAIQERSTHTVIHILQYMKENYNNITLNDVALKFGYTPAHICRLFTNQTKQTFGNALTAIKLNKAREFLISTNYKIYVIADMVGYDSHEYFQRLFKKHFGITPLQFRTLNKNK